MPAGFFRRLAAFVIDTLAVLMLAMALFLVWVISELGGLPETPAESAIVLEASRLVMPGFIAKAMLIYAIASFTPLLGRRSVGMRQLGISVVRDGR